MTSAERFRYAFAASREARSLGASPLKAISFWLAPEPLVTAVSPRILLRWRTLSFQVRRRDWGPVHNILRRQEYEPVKHLIGRPDPVILDLGANCGVFSVYALGQWPAARVFSVEPDPSTYQLLEANQRANPGHFWQTRHAAVAATDGVTRFRTGVRHSTTGHAGAGGDTEVPAVSLATLIDWAGGRVDLLKMDIEGAEEEALKAAGAHLDKAGAIVVQVHPARVSLPRTVELVRAGIGVPRCISDADQPNPVYVASRSATE